MLLVLGTSRLAVPPPSTAVAVALPVGRAPIVTGFRTTSEAYLSVDNLVDYRSCQRWKDETPLFRIEQFATYGIDFRQVCRHVNAGGVPPAHHLQIRPKRYPILRER